MGKSLDSELESVMLSMRSIILAVLSAFWVMGFISELDSARATTTYLLISLMLLALMALIRPAPSAKPNN
jgi:uncharacterized membrane protein